MDPNLETQTNDQPGSQGEPQDQIQTQAAGNPDSGVAGGEGGEGQTPPAPPPEPFFRRKSEAVPMERFNEVNNRAKTAESEAALLRARIAELERSSQPAAQQQPDDDPNSIDPAKFTKPSGEFDGAAYMAERERRIEARAERRAVEAARRTLEERDQQATQARHVDTLNQSFRSQVAEASKANPVVAEAVQYLDSIAHHIAPPVQLAILGADPEVALRIASDESLLAQVVRGNPADSQRLIYELNGHVKALRGAAHGSGAGIPAFVPGAAASQAPARPSAPVPRQLPGGGAAPSASGNLSQAEYNRRRAKGEL